MQGSAVKGDTHAPSPNHHHTYTTTTGSQHSFLHTTPTRQQQQITTFCSFSHLEHASHTCKLQRMSGSVEDDLQELRQRLTASRQGVPAVDDLRQFLKLVRVQLDAGSCIECSCQSVSLLRALGTYHTRGSRAAAVHCQSAQNGSGPLFCHIRSAAAAPQHSSPLCYPLTSLCTVSGGQGAQPRGRGHLRLPAAAALQAQTGPGRV